MRQITAGTKDMHDTLVFFEKTKTAKGLHSTCIHCKMKTKKQRKFKGE